ncbi:hypothetical protein BGW38_000149 [Lunasporangiospora selenospora]|uniref:NADH dehydrogenase [ubiquinone] iron-sulfur protein 4, mitochondrial n=1 Tax=Lunasporangiospora selenospora TaxID=979761 RepID=A0A9P6FV97_9FUNG|nr:hypothetical protein BGW38_000149 [Lunasporangiospora selenospora]
MSASILVKQAFKAPLVASLRPLAVSPAFYRFNSTNASGSTTAVTETRAPTSLQAEIISGAPEEIRLHPCRIYKQAKGATQSGIVNTGVWRLDFDTDFQAGRFENELIGWASSSDYMQALAMKFNSKEEAMTFADRQGWEYTVEEPNKKIFKKKIYADNFKYSPKKLRFVKTK